MRITKRPRQLYSDKKIVLRSNESEAKLIENHKFTLMSFALHSLEHKSNKVIEVYERSLL